MNLAAIYHRPLSEFAFAVDDNTYYFRLRTAKNDIDKVIFGFADRAAMTPELSFETLSMYKVRTDMLYDWFEVKLVTEYERVAYYFEIIGSGDTVFYLGDAFEKSLDDIGRADYFQLPFNHRANRLELPSWVNDAVVYNIFPDSFASGKEFISKESSSAMYSNEECHSLLGGTINGICDSLEYIKELGCNCLYLNPFFAASSYHKYDLLDYFHVDPTRGTDEDFTNLVIKAHSLGFHVIIDGVFNHVCYRHAFFKDVTEKGKNSEYYSYFYNLGSEPVPSFPAENNAPKYTCFAYVPEMPKTDTSNPDLCEYFCSVGEYWVKKYDVDGWRLDVANEVDDAFLCSFRKRVKNAKKDAIVIGEVWENASHYINMLGLDSAMNYDFRRFVSEFVAKSAINAEEYDARVTNLLMRYPLQAIPAQLNLLDSHDVSRFYTLCGGDTDKMELAILLQMTFIGMPSIFYGDEAGLMGASEPEYRQAMNFDKSHPLYEIYRKLINLRKSENDLRYGDYSTICVDNDFYSFRRGSILISIYTGDGTYRIPEERRDVILKKNYSCGILTKGGYIVSRCK